MSSIHHIIDHLFSQDYHVLFSRVNYYLAYAFLIWVSSVNREAIWKAACGGNGIPQPNELAQLASFYIYTLYCIEVLYNSREPDILFIVTICGVIGVTNLTNPKNNAKPIFPGQPDLTGPAGH